MRFLTQQVLVLALVGVPLGAQAVRVDLGASAIAGYDSNVFGGVDGQSDWSALIAPRISLQDVDGKLRWQLRYEPEGEYFLENDDASTWDQHAFASASWRITPRTTISAFDSFARLESANNFNTQEGVATGDVVSELDFLRQQRDRNVASVGVVHRLSDVSTLSASGRAFYTDFEDEARTDNDGYAVSGSYQRLLSPRTSTGLFASWTRQQVEGLGGAASRSTDFFNASLSVTHAFSPLWKVSITAGPTWVLSDDPDLAFAESTQTLLFPVRGFGPEGVRMLEFQSCPPLDDGSGRRFVSEDCLPNDRPLTNREVGQLRRLVQTVPFEPVVSSSDDEDLTYFANASIVRRFEHGEAELFYRRQATENSSTNQGSSSVADILGARIILRPRDRLRIDAFANYTLRTAATDQLRAAIVVDEGIAAFTTRVGPGEFATEFVPGVATSVAARAVGLDRDFDTVSINIRLRVSYELLERTEVFFRAGYSKIENRLDGETIRDFDRYTAGIGVNYRFDPIFL